MFKVASLVVTCASSLLGLPVLADGRVDLVFADFRFEVPAEPAAAGVQGQELFLAIRYGDEVGKNYLTFTDQPTVPTNGCPPEEFFSKAMKDKPGHGESDSCDIRAIEDFNAAFVETSESGIWEGEGFRAYYLLQGPKSIVYLVGPKNTYIKIDTDFMSPQQLESLVKAAEIL